MKKVIKGILLTIATSGVLITIVCSMMLWWLESDHALDWLQSRINEMVPGAIAIEHHELSLLRPGVAMDGVAIFNPEGESLAGLDHFSLHLSWWPLVRGEILIEKIRITAPWANLEMLDSQGLNLIAALIPDTDQDYIGPETSDRSSFPFNITVRAIRLTDGRISFTPSEDDSHIEVTGITMSAAFSLKDRAGNLDLDIGDVRLRSDTIHLEPTHIDLQARLDGDQLIVSAFNAVSGQTQIRLTGTINQLSTSPSVEGVLAAETHLEELKKMFDLPTALSGPLKARLIVSGDAANPDAEIIVSIEDSRLAGQPVDRGDFRLNLQDRQVRIDPLSLQLADGTVTLKGLVNLREAFRDNFFSSPTDINNISFTLDAVQDIPDLNPWLNRFVDLSGRLSGQWSLSGKGVTPETISARLSMNGVGRNLTAPGMDRALNADVGLEARMNQGRITIDRFETRSEGLELDGDGYFEINEHLVAGNLVATAVDLANPLAAVGIPFVKGSCRAALSVNGNLRQPQFSADIVARNLKIDTYSLGNVSLQAAMDSDGRLEVSELVLQNRESRIQGHGRLRLLPEDLVIDPAFENALELSLAQVSAGDFMPSPPIAGMLHGHLKLGGAIESIGGELHLEASALKANAVTIGDVDAQIRLDEGAVVVDRFRLQNQGSVINVGGSIDLLTPKTLQFVARPAFYVNAGSDHIDPGHFVDNIKGDFTFKAEVQGTLDHPIGNVSLSGKRLTFAGQSLDAIFLDAHLDAQRLWMDRLLAQVVPGEHIVGTGWLGWDRTFDVKLNTGSVAVAHLHFLKDIFLGDGTVKADIAAHGRIDNPDVAGQLTVTDIVVNDSSMEDISLVFTLHDMQAEIKGNLNFEIDAACDLKAGDFKANLFFDRTETAAYFRAAGHPGFHGTLTGRVHAAGNLHDAVNASAKVNLDALHLMFEKMTLVQTDRLVLLLADRKLSVPDFNAVLLSEGHLKVRGDAHIGGYLDIAVNGRLPLAVAKHFNEKFTDANGMVVLKGNLTGETAAPQIDAQVNLEHIGIKIPGLAQRLQDLNGSIILTNKRLRVDRLEGRLGTGKISLAGTVDHDNFAPVRIDLGLKAHSLTLEIPGTLAVLVNSDIQVQGTDRQASARGEIVLLEGNYYRDVRVSLLQMATNATSRRRTVNPDRQPIAIPYFDTLGLDIDIRHRQPFDVQNNVAQLEISPDLRIGGTLANPVVNGRARVRYGFVTFQQRDFEVKRGIIDFVNPHRTTPEIDIESETEIRDWRINLALKGTPDNLAISLTSVPTETEADILSLILLGRTTREITSGASGSQRTTSQIMAGMIADTFGDDIRRSTGIDILEVEDTTGREGQDAGGVKVTIGRHLSDRMTVKYGIETMNGETIQRAMVEYKLLERILVNGSQSNSGLFGAELIYRIEFR
jgi:autotransporter translocation and assembly factor TamB